MKTTKIGAASALLIATLAVAFAPTAAADNITTCPEYLDENEPQTAGDVAECEIGVATFCLLDEGVPDHERASCLTGL